VPPAIGGTIGATIPSSKVTEEVPFDPAHPDAEAAGGGDVTVDVAGGRSFEGALALGPVNDLLVTRPDGTAVSIPLKNVTSVSRTSSTYGGHIKTGILVGLGIDAVALAVLAILLKGAVVEDDALIRAHH